MSKITNRMTKQSKENLMVAESIAIQATFPDPRYPVAFMVRCQRGNRIGYVHGGDGFLIMYPTAGAAERAIKRVRPDLAPTFMQ
jgi:hypothetical protein